MITRIVTITLRALSVVALGLPVMASAQQALYFVGKAAPLGSMSSAGQQQRAVYLRWDVLEGELPDDLSEFVVLRDGEELARLPAHAVMSASQIKALYAGAAQQRRYLESLTQLKRLALNDPDVAMFESSQFFAALHQRLVSSRASDRLFQALASRMDINIARARNRAFIDTTATADHVYELLAQHSGGETVRAGQVTVNLAESTRNLAVDDFAQVAQGACDELEAGKDHYTVALTWKTPGGENQADRLANQISVSGYDLYRSDSNVTQLTARDLAREARGLAHNSVGRLDFPDLQQVNDTPITSEGAQNGEPVFLETHDQLIAAGLRPGDTRAYYLVARDFAGQYGATRAVLVTIPDMSRPPAPWDVRTYADAGLDDPEMELWWEHITPQGYIDEFLSGRAICNRDEIEQSGRVESVGLKENCDTGVRRAVRASVSAYKVYRFDTFAQASAFQDADGDGFSDRVERQIGNGAQCDAGVVPDSGVSAWVENAKINVGTLQTGDPVVRFRDEIPADQPGTVFWYRIASMTADGRLSQLSAPVRAIFPDRSTPDVPVHASSTRSGDENCECDIAVINEDKPWAFQDRIGRTDLIDVQCGGAGFGTTVQRDMNAESSAVCLNDVVREQCGGPGMIDLRYELQPPGKNEPAQTCSVSLPDEVGFCTKGEVALVKRNCDGVPVEPGTRAEGPVRHRLNFPADTCGTLEARLGGQRFKLASSCGSATPGELEYEQIAGTLCLSAYSQDENNNQSPSLQMGCFQVAGAESLTPPGEPQPVSLEFLSDKATVKWRLPAEPIAVTMIELSRAGAQPQVLTQGVAQPGNDPQAVLRHDLVVPDSLFAGEEWCVRLRAIGPTVQGEAAVQSDWTAPLCTYRDTVAGPPQYLPWPDVPQAPQGDALSVLSGVGIGALTFVDRVILALPLAEIGALDNECTDYRTAAEGGGKTEPGLREPVCSQYGLLRADNALSEVLSFVVYRQARNAAGVLSDWQQVSPTIDRLHWDRQATTPTTWKLADPYIGLVPLDPASDQWQFVYVDRYPRMAGRDYRYQIVYFTSDQRIRQWRGSDWFGQADVNAGGDQ